MKKPTPNSDDSQSSPWHWTCMLTVVPTEPTLSRYLEALEHKGMRDSLPAPAATDDERLATRLANAAQMAGRAFTIGAAVILIHAAALKYVFM